MKPEFTPLNPLGLKNGIEGGVAIPTKDPTTGETTYVTIPSQKLEEDTFGDKPTTNNKKSSGIFNNKALLLLAGFGPIGMLVGAAKNYIDSKSLNKSAETQDSFNTSQLPSNLPHAGPRKNDTLGDKIKNFTNDTIFKLKDAVGLIEKPSPPDRKGDTASIKGNDNQVEQKDINTNLEKSIEESQKVMDDYLDD